MINKNERCNQALIAYLEGRDLSQIQKMCMKGFTHARIEELIREQLGHLCTRLRIDPVDIEVAKVDPLPWIRRAEDELQEKPDGDRRQLQMFEPRITPAEAVIGFAAWLTTRKETIAVGSTNDASPAAELANLFCRVNELGEPREEAWPNNITHPEEPAVA